MIRRLYLGPLLWLVALIACQANVNDVIVLYRSGHWFELRTSITEHAPLLIQGAVATAFNDPARGRSLLNRVIRSEPKSDAAEEAYGILCQNYIIAGQYSQFAKTYREWRQAFPALGLVQEQRDNVERFGDRPDQVTRRRHPGRVRHEQDSFTVPVSINGKTDDFLVDTGALHSVLTDREAKKFGLTIRNDMKVLTGASGDTANFRTAIARTVTVGEFTFNDVSFAVLEPVGPWRDVEVGVVGMPILLGIGSIRWYKDGTAELGITITHAKDDEPNLVFDRGHLLLRSQVLGKAVLTMLDTGATTTDLNANFTAQFPEAITAGKKATQEITGVGGTRTFDSIELSELAFGIGGMSVWLRPAQVSLQRIETIGGRCCVGNVGRDLLTQGQGFSIDLAAMILRME